MKHHVQRVVDHVYGPTGSVILHILIVFLLVKFVSFSKQSEQPEVEVMMMEAESIDLEELKELEKELEDIEPPEVDVQVNVQQDVPTPEEVESFENSDPDVDLSALDISDAASPLILKGLFSGRSAGARAGMLRAYGGSGATESAVLRALDWLKKEQKENGSWAVDPIAMTGLGLLTFLAHGETPNSKKYGATVEGAIRYLLSRQNADGFFGKAPNGGPQVYAHAIASYAISEAYGMTHVPALKTAMEGGIKHILNGQQTGGAWDYGYAKGERRDTSVSGWNIQAMKAAYLSGAENPGIKDAMKRAAQDLKSVYSPSNGRFSYGAAGGGSPNMTGVGVLGLQFLGHSKSPEVKGGLKSLEESKCHWKDAPHASMYGWYYITQAKFHKGGSTWSKWNKEFATTLVKAQAKDGHWDFPTPAGGKKHEHGSNQGPVYSTTLGALMLQVYYRNLPTFKEKASELLAVEEEEGVGGEDVVIEIL